MLSSGVPNSSDGSSHLCPSKFDSPLRDVHPCHAGRPPKETRDLCYWTVKTGLATVRKTSETQLRSEHETNVKLKCLVEGYSLGSLHHLDRIINANTPFAVIRVVRRSRVYIASSSAAHVHKHEEREQGCPRMSLSRHRAGRGRS